MDVEVLTLSSLLLLGWEAAGAEAEAAPADAVAASLSSAAPDLCT